MAQRRTNLFEVSACVAVLPQLGCSVSRWVVCWAEQVSKGMSRHSQVKRWKFTSEDATEEKDIEVIGVCGCEDVWCLWVKQAHALFLHRALFDEILNALLQRKVCLLLLLRFAAALLESVLNHGRQIGEERSGP